MLYEVITVLFLGEFFQPGVGRGEDQQSARVESFMNGAQEPGGVDHPVDEVAGENQVVSAESRLEIRNNFV